MMIHTLLLVYVLNISTNVMLIVNADFFLE
jgi:hypothetical protein